MSFDEAERNMAGFPVVITKPPNTENPGGLTFLVTAANIPLSKYDSIRKTLVEDSNHVVVGFFVNVLNPMSGHRQKAQAIAEIWSSLKREFSLSQYNIVGHSVGAKIALLVAALHDSSGELQNVICLDPCDQSPVEFTNDRDDKNVSLLSVKAPHVTITYTGTGFFIYKSHNGQAIYDKAGGRTNFKLISHENASHMAAYCDDDDAKVSWKAVMRSGDETVNSRVKRETLEMIQRQTKSNLAKKAVKNSSRKIKNVTGKVTGKVTGAVSSMKNDAKNASRGVRGMMMMRKMF